jgi:hypothetical protein
MRYATMTIGIALALMLAASAGCNKGEGRLNAKGRVLKSGVPFTVQSPEFVRVIFFPVTPEGAPPRNTYIAAFNPGEGTFRAVGPDGNGIPPGKYRIAIEHSRKRKDLFNGAFDGDRSPFVFDIDANSQEIVIDLDKK